MIEYRITLSRKPTLRLWRAEGKKRRMLAEVENEKASLVVEMILRSLPLEVYMKYRDGRVIYSVNEEAALKLLVALRGIIGLRNRSRITQILEATEKMDRGEVYWWYSLYLKRGYKAVQALRVVYL